MPRYRIDPIARRSSGAVLLLAAALGLSACTAAAPEPASTPGVTAGSAATPTEAPGATATLRNAEGAEVGTASFTAVDGALRIDASARGLTPGFHGFHLHGVGRCEPNSAAPNNPGTTGNFLSAGGHLGADRGDHPNHPGDLPSLLVHADGTAQLSFTTDRVTLADLTDADGTAVMVHSAADNFGNVPERYAAGGPDADTKGTGDAGGRVACGAVEARS